MKKSFKSIALVLFVTVGLVSCNSCNSSKEMESETNEVKEEVVSLTVSEPNEFFEEALAAFHSGKKEECVQYMTKSLEAMEELKQDFKNPTPLEKQLTNLKGTIQKVKENKITSEEELQKVFQACYHALAGHALLVTETYVEMDVPKDAKKSSHSAKYYLLKAEKNAISSSKHVYKDGLKEIELLTSKTESEFEKDEKAIKKGISNSFNFLKKIDENLEGGGE